MPTLLADAVSSPNVSQRPVLTPKEVIEITRAREEALVAPADGVCHLWSHLHGVSWDVSRRVESSANQRAGERGNHLAGVAASARTRASIRMGGEFYPGDRILFYSEDASRDESIVRNGMAVLGNVDGRRGDPLDRECLRLGMARAAAAVRCTGNCGFPYFLPIRFSAPAGGFRQEPNGALDLGRDQRKHGTLAGARCKPRGLFLCLTPRRHSSFPARV